MRRGIELGFFNGRAVVYDGMEPVAIDAQAGKGKLARFLGVNIVSPRTAHLTKIFTDPKDGELAWVSWKTLERQGYKPRFINAGRLYGYRSERYNFNTRLLEVAQTLRCALSSARSPMTARAIWFPSIPTRAIAVSGKA